MQNPKGNVEVNPPVPTPDYYFSLFEYILIPALSKVIVFMFIIEKMIEGHCPVSQKTYG